jgi:hypothetical protein
MPSPWDVARTFVQLRLEPIGTPADLTRYKVINSARNDAELGILTLTHEEMDFFVQHMIPSQDQVQYQQWLFQRVSNPARYRINGRSLASYSIGEQLTLLNAHWKSNKPVPPVS